MGWVTGEGREGGGERGRANRAEAFHLNFLPDSVIVDCNTSFASKQSR